MTSTVGGGGGSRKSRWKEQNQLICNSGRGGKKSDNFADVIYGSHLALDAQQFSTFNQATALVVSPVSPSEEG